MAINVKQGETLLWTCAYKDDAALPVDLTGATVVCTAENVYTQTRQALSVSVTGATTGQFQISATAAVTAGMTLGRWKTDLSFTWADSSITISTTFQFNIVETVTDGS